MRRFGYSMVVMVALASPAFAQDDRSELAERMEKLERDVSFVQKQVYRGGNADGAPINAGSMQVRFTQIDEEIRQIRGIIEQVQFQNKQTAAELKKLHNDVDYRLRALEQKPERAEAAAAKESPAPAAHDEDDEEMATTGDRKARVLATPPAKAAAVPAVPVDATKPAAYKPDVKEKPAPKAEVTATPAVTGADFPNANAHYSAAFKLLNEKKYSEAAASFDTFVKKYPTDPLSSNAYYWLGESQYSRSDFPRATESFRKGFEANPAGQKAPDNLYKLALALSQTKRKNEACIVLAQVVSKYGDTAARTAAKAQEARSNLQCP